MDWIKFQEYIFSEIVSMKHTMQNLAGYVQNDFESVLNDGKVTVNEIEQSIVEMNNDFDDAINRLNSLREKSEKIMKHYAKSILIKK
jgi:hypothetical protein